MALTKKTGKNLGMDTVTVAQFINLVNQDFEVKIKPRKKKILIEETLTVLPSKLDIAHIHRPMSDADREQAVNALDLVRKARIVVFGEEVTGIKSGDIPVIDWNNTLSIQRIRLKENPITLIDVSAHFSAMSFADRKNMIIANKPITVKEYMMVEDHSVMGTYNGED